MMIKVRRKSNQRKEVLKLKKTSRELQMPPTPRKNQHTQRRAASKVLTNLLAISLMMMMSLTTLLQVRMYSHNQTKVREVPKLMRMLW